jgi:hypothetical protein
MSTDENASRLAPRSRQIDIDNGVDGLAVARVVLAYTDPAPAGEIDNAIRESPLAL